MCKLGNILTTEKYDDDPLFNVVDNINNIDKSLPTLIIGWEKAKEIFPEACILEWQINEKWFWTFGKRKRRNRFIEDTLRFKEMLINELIKELDYEFMDILTMTTDEKKLFMNLLKDNKKKSVVLKDNMVFILYDNNKVYGVSLNDIKYKGNNTKIFIKQLYNNPSVEMLTNIDIPHSIYSKVRNAYYILPYLLRSE